MIPGIKEIGFGPNSERPYATLHEATAAFAEMGERSITTQVRIDGDVVPDFEGWELEFKGERFVLPVKEPQAQKNNTTRNSLVDLTFYSWPIYQMKRYFFFETTTTATGTVMADKYKASVNLNLSNFVALFNRVLDYYFHGKIVADLAPGSYNPAVTSIALDYSYIWDVLQDFYSLFNIRWTIAYDEENDIYSIKIGYPAPIIEEHEFEYGFSGGLLHFERQVQDDNIKNILLGRGGEKNVPYRYFKKTDPNNPEWAADPDAIKELENIYFDRIRDLNFRNYIQGWKTNPNRMLDTGDVVEEYDERRGSYDWAYKKGHEDTSIDPNVSGFDPVEYVKDQDSIDKYGERWGALDDNDDIFPTIQGIELAGLGRVDEVVAVSPIVTDDIQASMEAAAEIVSIEGVMSQVGTVPALGYIVKQIRGSSFTVPTGQVANIRNNGWFAINESSLAAFLSVNTDLSKVRIYDASTDTEILSADQGLPAGTYYYVIDITVQNASASTLDNVTYGVNGLELVISDASAESWKPTFDIWIKNIFQSSRLNGDESDEDYALRVWREILGDRIGNEAKVVFSDGFMSISQDYEFVIATYPAFDDSKVSPDGYKSEWRLTLYKCAAEYEETGLYIPNNTASGKPIAGDHFFFVGIDMPFLYVNLAEERLNRYKMAALDQMKDVNPTWVIRLDKVRADMVNADQQRFFDQVVVGCEMHVKDKRFTKDEILRLFANSITYTWHEPSNDNPYLLPDVEIVVSDKIVVEKSTVEKIQGDVDVLKATYAKMSDMESVIQQVAAPMFLRKTGEQDTSLSPTRFASTVTSRDFRQGGFGGQGWGLYRDNSSKYQKSPDAESSVQQTRGLRKAGALRASTPIAEEPSDAVMEIDKLVVRKEMQVNSLVVNQIAYIGGKQVNSAAAMECVQVVETDDSYICYFDQKQGSVKNLFQVNDIAMGQVFTPDNFELRYYKMIVTATDVDNITIAKAGRAGSGAPQKGDVIVQYGNIADESRQYVIVRDVIGGGYERMLSDLNSVDATGTEYYFAGCDMNSEGVPTALFSSEPEPLFDSEGEPLMSTEFARARFFIGGEDSHMEFLQRDRRLYLKGTIVQSPSGDEFPVVCFRGEYDTTGQTLYYYGDEVTYQGGTYLYINRVPSNTAPPNEVYWQVRSQAGASAKSVEIVASSLFFTFDHPESTTPTGDQNITLTCVTQNITGATYAWSYWNGTDWTPMPQTTNAVTIAYNFAGFIDKVAKVKVVVSGDNNLYDEVSIYKVTGGKDGENILIVDVDNEMDSVELNSNGGVKSTTVIETTASIHYGAEAQAITAATLSDLPTGCTYTVSYNTGRTAATFYITFPTNALLDSSQNIGVHLTSQKGSGVTSLTVLGLKEGTPRYSILPSTKVISRDKDNNCDPTGVSCQVMKQTADGYVDGLADGTLRYYLDEASTPQTYTAGQTILVGEGSGKFWDKIRFEFVVGGVVLDKETIFVVDDGEESVSVFLTNSAKVFAAGDEYALAATDTFEVVGFRGTTPLEFGEDFSIGTITGQIANKITAAVDSQTGVITVTVTNQLNTPQGTLTIPVTVSGYGTVNLGYKWSLALSGKGEKGDAGPTIRGPRQWDPNEGYVNDSEFIDVVYYDPTNSGSGLYYQRTKTQSGQAFPNLTPDQDTTHWIESDKFAFVAADLIVAEAGKVFNLAVRKLRTENMQIGQEKAIVDIAGPQVTIFDADGNSKVTITSDTIGDANSSTGSNYSIRSYTKNNISTSEAGEVSGKEEIYLLPTQSSTLDIDKSNNVVTIPALRFRATYKTPSVAGGILVNYTLLAGDIVIYSGSLSAATSGSGSEVVQEDSYSQRQITLPVGEYPIRLVVEYEGSGAGPITGWFQFGGGSGSSFPSSTTWQVAYPANYSQIAVNGAQFRYNNEGVRFTQDGAKVIQGGNLYNIAGLGLYGFPEGTALPKRIVFCKDNYPGTEETGVFYIKVSSS